MQEDRRRLHLKILVNLGVSLFWLIVIITLGPWLIRFFMPVIIAWIIAMIANPLVSFLERRIKLMRKHGSMLVIALVLVLVVTILFLLIRWLILEVSGWVVNLPELYQSVMTNLQGVLVSLHARFHFIPESFDIFALGDNLNDYIMASLDSIKLSSIQSVGGVAGSIVDGLVLSILTIMLAYFFVADRDQMSEIVRKHMPGSVKHVWELTKKILVSAIGGYLKACFKIMFVMFLILLVFFLFLRVDYAAVIALITAVLDFLPFIGTGTILCPWAVYNLLMGEYVRAIVLIVAYFVTLIVHRLLEPKLVGDSIGISPFLTLISMFIGYRLIGMLGLILGIPVGMLVKALIEAGAFESQIRGIKILVKDIQEFRKY